MRRLAPSLGVLLLASFAIGAVDAGHEPELVSLPTSCFTMGQNEAEREALIAELGQRRFKKRYADEVQSAVCVGAFRISRHEVTVAEFAHFARTTAYVTDAERDVDEKGCFVRFVKRGKLRWDWRRGHSWRDPGFEQGPQHPVVCVSFRDAARYVEWLNDNTDGGYRLPTEAEWEYAARAGVTSSRPWGDEPHTACAHANVGDRTGIPGESSPRRHECIDGHEFTAAVGRYRANRFGLDDMLGNVSEWTCSKYAERRKGAEMRCHRVRSGAKRVVRGGSWFSIPRNTRSAHRYGQQPHLRYPYLGFRVARDD